MQIRVHLHNTVWRVESNALGVLWIPLEAHCAAREEDVAAGELPAVVRMSREGLVHLCAQWVVLHVTSNNYQGPSFREAKAAAYRVLDEEEGDDLELSDLAPEDCTYEDTLAWMMMAEGLIPDPHDPDNIGRANCAGLYDLFEEEVYLFCEALESDEVEGVEREEEGVGGHAVPVDVILTLDHVRCEE